MSFAMMIVFVLFAGNSSSVVRASLMCALAIFCSCLGRRVHIAGLLGAALLVSVLSDPLSVADPGFQLSYAAVAGIIFVVSPVAIYLEAAIERRWLRWSLDCLCTVLVAQACVLPLQLFYFRQIGLLFLPANIVASLVVTPVTVAGFASSLVVLLCPFGTFLAPPFHWLAALLDWLAAVPLNILVSIVAALSSCRWAVLTVPNFALWQVILYYLIFVCLSVALTSRLKEIEKASCKATTAKELDGYS
jgi:competence protein ComEC